MKYFAELKLSMEWLVQDPRTVFIGQAGEVPGTALSNTARDILFDRRIELPVAEKKQIGMTVGLALQGQVPVSINPRWHYLLLAGNKLASHLDKSDVMFNCGYRPKSAIFTGIGPICLLLPQHQHVGDYTDSFRLMCSTVEGLCLDAPDQIFTVYEKGLVRHDGRSTPIVESGDYYAEK